MACVAAAEAGAADAVAGAGGLHVETLMPRSDGALVIWGDNLHFVASLATVSFAVIGNSSALSALEVSAGHVASRVRAASMVPRPRGVSSVPESLVETVPGFLVKMVPEFLVETWPESSVETWPSSPPDDDLVPPAI